MDMTNTRLGTPPVAVVTGAGGGIGYAISERLLRDGYHVVLVDIDADALAAAQKTLDPSADLSTIVITDVAKPDDVASLFANTVVGLGTLELLVNNAAAVSRSEVERDCDVAEIDAELWDRVFAVNVRGTMLCCKGALPMMASAGRGAVVNLGSRSSVFGDVTSSAYGSSKAAISGFTRYVAAMYGPAGIRCNAVAPAGVAATSARAHDDATQLNRNRAERLLPWAPRPDDVASLVAYLASDEATAITGQTIFVDSGVTVNRPMNAIRRWEQQGSIGER